MHQSSYEKMRDFVDRYLADRRNEHLDIVDLGSQDVNGSYRPLFEYPGWHYRGLDLAPGRNVDIVLERPYRWPTVASSSIDVCISGQALEHVPFFWLTALEVARVLKPGGLCCLIAPSGGYEHRYPVDCWRFYPDGMVALAHFARLEVVEARTDWTPRSDYSDDSAAWKDTVLVARKPRLRPWQALRARVRRHGLRLLTGH